MAAAAAVRGLPVSDYFFLGYRDIWRTPNLPPSLLFSWGVVFFFFSGLVFGWWLVQSHREYRHLSPETERSNPPCFFSARLSTVCQSRQRAHCVRQQNLETANECSSDRLPPRPGHYSGVSVYGLRTATIHNSVNTSPSPVPISAPPAPPPCSHPLLHCATVLIDLAPTCPIAPPRLTCGPTRRHDSPLRLS